MSFEKVKEIIESSTDDINEIYFNFTSLGKSRDRHFDKFLHKLQSLVCDFHNIIYICKYEEKTAIYTLKKSFSNIDDLIHEIDIDIEQWESKFIDK